MVHVNNYLNSQIVIIDRKAISFLIYIIAYRTSYVKSFFTVILQFSYFVVKKLILDLDLKSILPIIPEICQAKRNGYAVPLICCKY